MPKVRDNILRERGNPRLGMRNQIQTELWSGIAIPLWDWAKAADIYPGVISEQGKG